MVGRRLAWMCGCAIALALAAPAASLAARPPASFFGVAAWTPPSAAEFERMGRARLGVFRSTLLWSVVERRRGRRDWRYYDELVARSSRAGLTILPTLVGSPRFAASRETFPPRGGRPMRRWLGFVRAAVNRYGRRGRIWRRHPELPYRPIRAWQVWNEPNFPSWWRGQPDARQYTRFLARSRGAIKRGDRRAKVILAGLPESPLGIPMKRFLPALYRAGARRLFDAVAVHGYARNHRGALAVVKRARRIMRRHGDRRKPIWVTEMGWATGGQVTRRTGAFTTTPAGQAARVTRTFRAFIRARKRLRIGMVVWFSWRDRPPIRGERDWWGLHTGLFDVHGNPKPAWPALVRQTGGDPDQAAPAPPAPPPAPPPGSGGDGGGGGGGGGDPPDGGGGGGGGGGCPLIIVCP